MITAKLSNYRQSPRKVRLVADLVKGKKVEEAIASLAFIIKSASLPITKLLKSAVRNAEQNFNLKKENLYIKSLRIDSGPVLKRSMPRARGSAFPILKRTSNILLILDEKK
ncbi:MAG: 50S ribosomal protein L22 [Candidatus Paceibacterota bacterium]|jgi:large subunit ribosomal protein L22